MNLQSVAARRLAWLLVPGVSTPDGAVDRTRAFLDEGLIDPGGSFSPVSYSGGEMWSASSGRSLLRRLHGLLFVADWRVAHSVMGGEERARLVVAAAELVGEWQRRFGARAGAPEMAYHDETTAQRLLMLTALSKTVLAGTSHHDAVGALAAETAEILAAPDFYAGNNNHGMFQDTALLAYAVLVDEVPEDARLRFVELALGRLRDYAAACFTSEGVHIEHSPTYHVMVVRSLGSVAQVAREIGASEFARFVAKLVERSEAYTTHAISPRGVFPPVSDTRQVALMSEGNLEYFRSDGFRYAASRGAEGRPPKERAATFPESGYAAFRSSWEDAGALFCFFTAAYNGGYHKHSDELSLHVEVAGSEVIREAGPNGYDYQDPFTQYGFSSFAHNTLVVDDQGLPRHDGRVAETWMEDLASDAEKLDVRGVTTRFDGVRFERRLTAAGATIEEATVKVEDTVTSAVEHKYSFFWHLGPDVEHVIHGDLVELFVRGSKVLEMSFEVRGGSFELHVERGRKEPRLSGWMFPQMGQHKPTSTLSLTLYGTDCSVRTSMRFASATFRLVDRGVRPSGSGWKFRPGAAPLTYLLDVPEEGEVQGLVVAFSAIGKPYDFTYNYRSTLDGLPVARLFVLDNFGDQGVYYYSRSRVLGPYLAVQALLREVLSSLSLPPSSMITAGSSKGGTAALIHGLGAGARRIIVGAPQTRVGTFLKSAHPRTLGYMAGGTGTADVLWANGIVERAVMNAGPTSAISVLVGQADHHFAGHVRPFVRLARERGLAVDEMVIPDAPHARIGQSYRQYLRSGVESWLGEDTLPHCLAVGRDGELSLSIDPGEGMRTSAKLFRGAQVVDSTPYEDRHQYRWPALPPGSYRARVYRRPGPSTEQAAFTTARVVLPG